MKSIVSSASLVALASCSGQSPAPGPVALSASDPSAPSAIGASKTLFYFDGNVDPDKGTMTVTVRSPTGELTSQSTLPYGPSAGDVYFHTCAGTPAFNTGTHLMTGAVQAVNLMTSNVGDFTAVIDSTIPSTVTPSSGVMFDYGNVAPNTASNCGSPNGAWTFTDPTNAPFTFAGHAEGGVAPIFYDDFSSLSSSTTGSQCNTGDTVYAFGTLSLWNAAGLNAIHGVQWEPGNIAAQFYGGNSNGQQNSLTMKSGVENVSGKHYTVQFLGGPGNWNSCGQGTTVNNDLVFTVTAGAAVLTTYTYQPAAWVGTEVLSAATFGYTGNGNGSPAVMTITAGGTAFGTFGGAIDDVGIYSP
jgi:hypothetical protein